MYIRKPDKILIMVATDGLSNNSVNILILS